MKAAVVEAFDRAPRYGDFEAPIAQTDEVIVLTRATALGPIGARASCGQTLFEWQAADGAWRRRCRCAGKW